MRPAGGGSSKVLSFVNLLYTSFWRRSLSTLCDGMRFEYKAGSCEAWLSNASPLLFRQVVLFSLIVLRAAWTSSRLDSAPSKYMPSLYYNQSPQPSVLQLNWNTGKPVRVSVTTTSNDKGRTVWPCVMANHIQVKFASDDVVQVNISHQDPLFSKQRAG